MNSILHVIHSSLSGATMGEISDSLEEGLGKTVIATGSALPVLISALSQQARRDNGEALGNALERDHDGEILRDIRAFVAAGDFSDGGNILGHLLGDKKSQTAQAISTTSGMRIGNADTLLDMLAPVIMGAVGKVKIARRLDSQDITELLADGEKEINEQLPGVISAVGVFLDKDGDGQTELAELMAHGRGILTKFF